EFDERHVAVTRQVLFSVKLVVPVVIQLPKARGQSSETPYQRKLRSTNAMSKTELGLARKGNTAFGLRLYVPERIAYRQTDRDRCVEAVACKRKVAGAIRDV